MEPAAILTFAIIGRGLIGHSLELAFRSGSHDVVALDRGDALGRAAGADVIFLAAPIRDNIAVLRELPSAIPGEALVTDTGSTKASTVAASGALPPRLRFIGGHPVAGGTTSGAAGAAADLFRGRPWILTPAEHASADDLATLRTIIGSLGAVPHEMDAAEHDRLFAYLSHLPQLAVSALMHVVGSAAAEEGLKLAGAGLRDSTRLAASPGALWQEIAADNRRNLSRALSDLIDALAYLRDDPGRYLPGVFEDAARWKRILDERA